MKVFLITILFVVPTHLYAENTTPELERGPFFFGGGLSAGVSTFRHDMEAVGPEYGYSWSEHPILSGRLESGVTAWNQLSCLASYELAYGYGGGPKKAYNDFESRWYFEHRIGVMLRGHVGKFYFGAGVGAGLIDVSGVSESSSRAESDRDNTTGVAIASDTRFQFGYEFMRSKGTAIDLNMILADGTKRTYLLAGVTYRFY